MRIENYIYILRNLNMYKPILVSVLSKKLYMSASTISRAIKELKKHSLIVTRPGRNGGLLLAIPFNKLTIGDFTPLIERKDCFLTALAEQLPSLSIERLMKNKLKDFPTTLISK